MKILTISEAREKLTSLVANSSRLLEKYLITVNGKPGAVLMSHDEHESLMETLDILSQPGALKEIREAEKELKEGKYITLEELKVELGIV